MATKGDKISVKSFYDGMVKRGSKSFSTMRNWNSWAPTKVSFFCLRSNMERDSNCKHLEEEGWTPMNKCFLCKGEEESCDHILLHCSKASLLWQLVFSLFGVVWVLHTLVQAKV